MKIVLVAEESAGVRALQLLAESPHDVWSVVTASRAADHSRGRTVAALAQELGIRTLPGDVVTDAGFADVLQREAVDVLLNVHSLNIVRSEVLLAVRVGCFNLHPGPLPGYAGLNAPSWAIYNGESSHGVTLHRMAAGIDTGSVVYQASFPLTARDTGLTVASRCIREGMTLISRLLGDLDSDPGSVPSVPQDLTRRRYFGRSIPHDGWVPWHEGAARVLGLVRACDYGPWPSPWGRARTCLADTEIGLRRARPTGVAADAAPGTVGRCEDASAWVATGDEWVAVTRLQVAETDVPVDAVLRPTDVLGKPIMA